MTELSGTWRIVLDPEDQGVAENWFLNELPGTDVITLPGSIQEAGFGDAPGPDTFWTGSIKDKSLFSNPRFSKFREEEGFKTPFWLMPPKVYKGVCWFQRRVTLEEKNQEWELFLERCHWTTRAWLGTQELGTRDSLSVPQLYRFQPETVGEQVLTLRVDNRLHVDVGPNSHSVSDHTQGNWNGVVGKLELRQVCSPNIEWLVVDADPESGCVKVDVHLDTAPGDSDEIRMQIFSPEESKEPALDVIRPVSKTEGDAYVLREELEIKTEVSAWSPHHPHVYHLRVELIQEGVGLGRKEADFGFVSMAVRGTHFLVNGRPIQLRGTLDCAIFPKHSHPPMEVEEWERVLGVVREYGLNHVRFHSWCPPEAAFVAGDRLGILFQVECGSWANTTSSLGNGEPIDRWLYEEGERIVREYGNHPCFRLMAYGNEPAGPGRGGDYLSKWVTHWKQRDPRRLHTGGAGWPKIPENDFHNLPEPRLQAWGAGLEGWLNAQPPSTDFDLQPILEPLLDRPVVSHEIGQWCVYPDMNEIQDYQGFFRAANLEVYRDLLKEMDLLPLAKAYHQASGRLQVLCYKAEIEAALRSHNLAGFQLLGLQDFPGQGTAPVGVVDAFWSPKSYVDAKEFREFCSDSVPLAVMDRFVFREGELMNAELLWAHFGEEDLPEGTAEWALSNTEGKPLAHGVMDTAQMPAGELSRVGEFEHTFEEIEEAQQLELSIGMPGTESRNRWSVFVYPRVLPAVDLSQVRVAEEWSPDLATELEKGGSVWLRLKPFSIDTRIRTGFSSIFWNTPWTRGQAPHTLGILCDPEHPALAEFPTAFHSDVQWWSILKHAAPMELDRLGWNDGGIVSLVPDWADPKPLSLAFEARVGSGKVFVTSIDFDASEDPALKQLEVSLSRYWTSGQACPERTLTPGRLLTLLE